MPTHPNRSRRRGGVVNLSKQVSVAMDPVLFSRIEATADRYGLARGAVARLAIERGLRDAQEHLRRTARSEETK